MKLKFISTAFFTLVAAICLSSCLKAGEDNMYIYDYRVAPDDSSLTLAKVVNTGLYFNDSELPDYPPVELVGDTLNVFVAVHANVVTDSLIVNYRTYNDVLYLTTVPFIDPKLAYAQSLSIITRKLQFVGKVDKEYKVMQSYY